ncbi:MAG: 3-hydroxybutyryl-CoA dehydrogenase [Microbacterium sp. 71-36]|uniref:3-hydroxyacyl-CoA dehydrogenase family protein n=1 Tax=unclassified Microbacterium TaxID=2609290 RepID=UPI00086B8D25|nr:MULTISPECIES: 3-hydroxyacyl-CoA dehydrogenase family protein [unclassified Microbacterium]MBN9212740.1 3-hydroxyacyl-CoA dehydrogenase family protein [Microbacterium sp.]ODT41600.1 MAG: 3-hydroxybutyryl-CoA dehydrogenase [Microbacterium sp. SCN 71-17]OJV77557.1 MAG: 3-hydroxybutyryl-CoA dehydrogenase [Microbacterium sp. 71-36]
MSAAPSVVGVLGGGRMGAGIAHAFLLAGSRVHVVERDVATADAAAARVRADLDRSAARGRRVPDADALTVGVDPAAFADAALVVEAVPEDRALKGEALTRIEAVLADEAVVASNTSSISIDALAAGLRSPERFLGLHFFNPVPASALVEIVRGTRTAEAIVARATRWVEAIGKTAVVVRDAPGFASSRLGVALGLEAIRMLEEGVASAEDIDRAVELGYRHPVGPLRTTDLVGLDVRLGIAEELERSLGPRFAPPALLRRLVDEGRLGRKTGRGFYEWSE